MKILLLTVLLLTSFVVSAQEMIISGNLKQRILVCNSIIAENEKIFYTTSEDSAVKSIPILSVLSVRFVNEKLEIVIPYLELDTFRCRIDSVGNRFLYTNCYINKNYGKIPKNELFGVIYHTDSLPVELNNYRDYYQKAIIGQNNKKDQILIISNKEPVYCKVLGFDSLNVYVSVMVNEKPVKSYFAREKVKEIIYNQNFSYLSSSGNFLLSRNGTLREFTKIKLFPEKIQFEYLDNQNNYREHTASKKEIAALLFYNYKNPELENLTQLPGSINYNKFDFNISLSYSQLLGASADKELSGYVDDLRKGYDITIDANGYPSSNFGIGGLMKLSFFSGRDDSLHYSAGGETISSISTQNTRFFVGPNIALRSNPKNKFSSHGGLSIGWLHVVSSNTINDDRIRLTGNNIGLYGYFRPTFYIDSKNALFFNFAAFAGIMKSYRYDGYKAKLKSTESFSSIEIGAGLKF